MGNAYLWRGSFVAELTYNDDRKSAGQVAAAATELLPPLLAAIADKLPGPDDLPAAAQALPADKRIALGIRMVTGDVLDVSGAGPGAVGYYRDGEQRWRVLAVVRQSSAEAESVLATLGASDSAREKGLGDEGVRLLHGAPGAPRTEWLVARQGARLFGVGDEPLVLREGMTADERGRLTLTAARKRELLGHLLAGIGHIEGGSPRAP
jgi:hypothetical protein